jgi:hypothetical protein
MEEQKLLDTQLAMNIGKYEILTQLEQVRKE